MIYQRRTNRQAGRVARSQLAVRMALGVYSGLCAVVLLRCAVLLAGFPDTVWTVSVILAASNPFTAPFRLAPAANRVVAGEATLADATALLVLLALPLLLIGRRRLSSGS